MGENPTTIILCGGRGTRLKPYTDSVPKSLIPLKGRPLLDYILETHLERGIRRFVLCVGYRGEMIKEFIRRHPKDAEICFSDAGENASMLERIYEARQIIRERAFVAYGDTLIRVNLKAMLQNHLENKALITLTTAALRSPFGLVSAHKDGWISSFVEKPVQHYFVGHFLIEREVLDDLPPGLLQKVDGQGLIGVFENMIDRKALRNYAYDGPQMTFNTAKDLVQAEQGLGAFFTSMEELS